MTFVILVTIGWMYVAVMMAVVEATSSTGSVLGALFTFMIYGVLPLAIVLYLLSTPARRRARNATRSGEPGVDPDQRRHPPGDPVAPAREEP